MYKRAYIKLASLRLAINYILRNRLQKQSSFSKVAWPWSSKPKTPEEQKRIEKQEDYVRAVNPNYRDGSRTYSGWHVGAPDIDTTSTKSMDYTSGAQFFATGNDFRPGDTVKLKGNNLLIQNSPTDLKPEQVKGILQTFSDASKYAPYYRFPTTYIYPTRHVGGFHQGTAGGDDERIALTPYSSSVLSVPWHETGHWASVWDGLATRDPYPDNEEEYNQMDLDKAIARYSIEQPSTMQELGARIVEGDYLPTPGYSVFTRVPYMWNVPHGLTSPFGLKRLVSQNEWLDFTFPNKDGKVLEPEKPQVSTEPQDDGVVNIYTDEARKLSKRLEDYQKAVRQNSKNTGGWFSWGKKKVNVPDINEILTEIATGLENKSLSPIDKDILVDELFFKLRPLDSKNKIYSQEALDAIKGQVDPKVFARLQPYLQDKVNERWLPDTALDLGVRDPWFTNYDYEKLDQTSEDSPISTKGYVGVRNNPNMLNSMGDIVRYQTIDAFLRRGLNAEKQENGKYKITPLALLQSFSQQRDPRYKQEWNDKHSLIAHRIKNYQWNPRYFNVMKKWMLSPFGHMDSILGLNLPSLTIQQMNQILDDLDQEDKYQQLENSPQFQGHGLGFNPTA